MKKCTKCETEKTLEEFHKDKSKKDGRRPSCKACTNKQQNQRNSTKQQKEAKRKYDKQYNKRTNVIERNRLRHKQNYSDQEYVDHRRTYGRKYYSENKEKKLSYAKAYSRQIREAEPACIYQIKNTINNKVYIGQTFRGKLRWKQHIRILKTKKHKNHKLQQDFDKYGQEAFEWSVIKEYPQDREMLMIEEAREIQRRIDDGNDLYNIIISYKEVT